MRKRALQRFHTEPASFSPYLGARRLGGLPLVPDTDGVSEHLASAGPNATLLDVALSILDRLQDVPGNDADEVHFVRECLLATPETTAMPCVLLDSTPGGSQGEYGYLMSTYAKQDLKSKDSVPGSPMSRSRTPSMPAALGDTWQTEAGDELLEEFETWCFNSFRLAREFPGRTLQFAGWKAMEQFCINDDIDCAMDREKVVTFLECAEEMYANQDTVLYHNNVHAADVTQCVHAALGDLGFDAYFDDLSTLALVLGAIVHDMGHDGRTNNYHINIGDDLALTYNDISVLENMHISKTFKLLSSNPDANVMDGLKLEQRTRLRKEMVEVVLGTDMSSHFGNIAEFKNLTEKIGSDSREWHQDSKAASSLRIMLLHAMDISNPTKSLNLSDKWSDLLKQEFFLQGDEEKRLGLPVSPLCDRDTVRFASSQVGFFTIIVKPTFALLAALNNKVSDIVLTELARNTEEWEKRKKLEIEESPTTS